MYFLQIEVYPYLPRHSSRLTAIFLPEHRAPSTQRKNTRKNLQNVMARETTSKETTTGRLDRSPIHLLHRAGQCAGEIFQAEMGGGDLTPRQYAVLVSVSQNEGLSQTDLVEKTGIDRSTLADIVRRMLKKGLLQRRRTKEDARAYAVKLTEDGWRTLKTADPVARRVDDKVLSVLQGAQRDRFVQDLNTIVQALSKLQPPNNRLTKG